jgi:hypothetical protein
MLLHTLPFFTPPQLALEINTDTLTAIVETGDRAYSFKITYCVDEREDLVAYAALPATLTKHMPSAYCNSLTIEGDEARVVLELPASGIFEIFGRTPIGGYTVTVDRWPPPP